jgi:hypothetical protein
MAKIKDKREENKRNKYEETRLKEEYISNLVQGRYFLERCNMMTEQLQPTGLIIEKVDGCTKTKGLLLAEYDMTKRSAINCMRKSFFAKQKLIKLGWTKKDFEDALNYYFNEPILKKDYGRDPEDETEKVSKTAQFGE